MSDTTAPADEDTREFDQYENETRLSAKIAAYPRQVLDELAKVTFPTRPVWFRSWISVITFATVAAGALAAVDWAVSQLVLALN